MKRDLELATTGTPLSSTQRSGEALLIMQIWHRLLAAQTHWKQRQHLFLSISYKHSTWCWAAHPRYLSSLTLSVSIGELIMSIGVTQAPWFNLLVVKLQSLTFTNSHWLRSGDKNPVNTDQINNDLFAHEMCSEKSLRSLDLSATYAVLSGHETGGESQPAACPSFLEERKMTAQLYCPWGLGRTRLCTSTLSIYYSN